MAWVNKYVFIIYLSPAYVMLCYKMLICDMLYEMNYRYVKKKLHTKASANIYFDFIEILKCIFYEHRAHTPNSTVEYIVFYHCCGVVSSSSHTHTHAPKWYLRDKQPVVLHPLTKSKRIVCPGEQTLDS